jgi:hypothetical protein
MPASTAISGVSFSFAAYSRTCCVISIEQKCAPLRASFGNSAHF